MKKLILIFVAICFFFERGVAQDAVPMRDTASFLYVVDTKNVTEEGAFHGEIIILINGKLYNGHNFPFSCLLCHNPIKNSLYYTDFRDIINLREQKKFMKDLMNAPLYLLDDTYKAKDPVIEKTIKLLQTKCLPEVGRYRLSYVSAEIVYFLIDCNIPYGVDDIRICNDLFVHKKTPVILRIKEI